MRHFGKSARVCVNNQPYNIFFEGLQARNAGRQAPAGFPVSPSLWNDGQGMEPYHKGNCEELHPWNLTWNLKRSPWKRWFILETIVFRFHVKFRGSSAMLTLFILIESWNLPLEIVLFGGVKALFIPKVVRNKWSYPIMNELYRSWEFRYVLMFDFAFLPPPSNSVAR